MRRPRQRRKLARLCAPLLAVLTTTALAPASETGAAAQALFDQAKADMAADRYERACPALEESQKLDPALGTLLNLAACYEKMGRTASAWSRFLEAAAAARKSGHPDAERVARDRARALERRLSKLTITVPAAGEPGLEVLRDGVSLGPAEFGVPIPVDPGSHVVSARAPGRKPWQTDVIVSDARSVSTRVPELEQAPVEKPVEAPAAKEDAGTTTPPAALPPPEPEAAPSHTRRTVGYVVGSVGIAAVAAGGVFAALTKSKDNEADKLCNGAGTDVCKDTTEKTRYEETVSDAKQNALFAYVGFGVGAAALATGAYLILSDPGDRPKSALTLVPIVDPRGAGVLAQGRF